MVSEKAAIDRQLKALQAQTGKLTKVALATILHVSLWRNDTRKHGADVQQKHNWDHVRSQYALTDVIIWMVLMFCSTRMA